MDKKLREIIIDETQESINMFPYAEHNDLISFIVTPDCFYANDTDVDFTEMTVIVDKEWLFNFMSDDGILSPREFLRHEYTTDDSYTWYQESILQNNLMGIIFDNN